MKTKLLSFLLLLCFALTDYGATLATGYTFSAGETNITAAKLNSIVNSATISGISGSDIGNLTITSGNLANNSVTGAKILDSTITTADLMSRGLLGTEIRTNGISEIELNTNLNFRTGFITLTNSTLTFLTNQIGSGSVNGTSVSAGAGDAGKVVRLNGSGLIDSTMTPFSQSFTSTNLAITAAGSLTQAHGLSSSPSLIQCRLKCISTELNYSVNDEVICDPSSGSGVGNYGISVVPDATNLNIRYGSQANTFFIPDKTTGAGSNVTDAKWVLIIRAWK